MHVMHLSFSLYSRKAMLLLQFEENHFSSNFDVRKGKIEHTWFKGGRTNIAYNCLDRHIKEDRGSTTCFLWEGNEPKDSRSMTYQEVLDEVCRVVRPSRNLSYVTLRHLQKDS